MIKYRKKRSLIQRNNLISWSQTNFRMAIVWNFQTCQTICLWILQSCLQMLLSSISSMNISLIDYKWRMALNKLHKTFKCWENCSNDELLWLFVLMEGVIIIICFSDVTTFRCNIKWDHTKLSNYGAICSSVNHDRMKWRKRRKTCHPIKSFVLEKLRH